MKKSILTYIFLLVSFCAAAQGGWLRPNNSYGTIQNRFAPDSILHMPTGCGTPRLNSRFDYLHKAAQYFDSCNKKMYVYDPKDSTWAVLTGTGSTFTSIDSSVITGDTICLFSGGVELTCFTLPSAPGDTTITGVQNVTVLGDQLCVYTVADTTCYTVNNTIINEPVRDTLAFDSHFDVDTINPHRYNINFIDPATTGIDGIISITNDPTLVDSTVTINPTINYRIGGIPDSVTTVYAFDITSADSGMYRVDVIYLASDGTVQIATGTQGASIVIPPIPSDAFEILKVNIFGSSISITDPSLSSLVWRLGGNTIVDTDSTIGTNSANGFGIITNGQRRVTIDMDGNTYLPMLAFNGDGNVGIDNEGKLAFRSLPDGTVCGDYVFNTGTSSSDPGSGFVKLNNATYASVTNIYIDDISFRTSDIQNLIHGLSSGDVVFIKDNDNANKYVRLTVSGTPTDNTGWWTIPVTYSSGAGSLFSNNDNVSVCFLYGGGGSGSGGLQDAITNDPVLIDDNVVEFDNKSLFFQGANVYLNLSDASQEVELSTGGANFLIGNSSRIGFTSGSAGASPGLATSSYLQYLDSIVLKSPTLRLASLAGSGGVVGINSSGVLSVVSAGGSGTVTSVSGTTNRISVSNPTTTPVIDISVNYVGQTSITTLGTVVTATWNATPIADLYIASAATWNAKLSPSDTNNIRARFIPGTNISFSGTYPDITINASGGGTPAGSNTQVQFNNSGAFGASANLVYASNILSVKNGAANLNINPGMLEIGDDGTGGYASFAPDVIYQIPFGTGGYELHAQPGGSNTTFINMPDLATPFTMPAYVRINSTNYFAGVNGEIDLGTIGGLTSSNFVDNEIPSGTINGSNVTFTLANTPTTGTTHLYVNGVRMKPTTHYSISGTTLTFVTAPLTGSDILIDYRK